MKDLTVAALQMVSGEDVAANLAQGYRLAQKAASEGAKIALLPENFAHLADQGSYTAAETFASGDACPQQQPIQHAVQHWARELGIWLIAGATPLLDRPNGQPTAGRRCRSACLLYDNHGRLHARYDKIHLFDVDVDDAAGRYRESNSIEPGDAPCTISTPFAKLGLSICFDLRFPELYRTLASAGAEVIVVPAAFTHATGQAHWLTLLKARAIENGCYVIAANQGGQHSAKRRTWGHSVIIDPWGDVLAEAGEGEAVITATLSSTTLEKVRRNMPLLSMRRL
ncbi:carbon-nitrogen hydrolase family protein [Microbulbifer elongatus]|uniref:Carbon-nitrogen hydrolase family protein n=1 Tax=Microbulbifer elongatus TaxID=86173 RepID=A0ABT1P2W3_9GAMM|nr:carbon-nitrogen hydrolase family protein [Microbulbifer elongatus]MCQ3829862.1 carbon-nitrogen hydrolase family protein [Microbulbifer elongatus]